MRNSKIQSFKDVYEYCEININEAYRQRRKSDAETASIADADKDYIIARYHMINSEFYVAREYFELAEVIYTAHGDQVALALLYSQMAHCFRSVGEKEKSEEYIEKAVEISKKTGEPYCLINSYIHGASNAFFQDEKAEGLKYNELLRPLIKEGSKLQYGHYCHNLAFAEFAEGNYEEFVKYCETAYDAYRAYHGNDRSRNVLIAANNKAEGYVHLEEYDKAIALFEYVVRGSREEGHIQILMHALMQESELYYNLKDYKNAFLTFKDYIEIYRTWLQERLNNPEDENQELKRKLEIAQDLEMVKSAEYIEKKHFLEQLLASQKFVREVGSHLISATDIEEIFVIICKAAKKLFMYDNISMGLIEGDYLVVRYLKNEDGTEEELPVVMPLDSKDYISTTCLTQNRDIKLNSVEEFINLIQPADIEETIRERDAYNESLMFVRLMHEGRAFGVITVQKKEPNVYSDEAFSAIQAMGSFVSIAINNVFKTQAIEDKVRELEVITLRDELTYLENRRSYNLYVDELVRNNVEYMLIFADMNHLKQINDGIGHNNGDLYLITLANIIKSCVKDYRKFRLSGDEFAVIIPNPSIEYTYELVEKIKRECAKIDIGEYPLAIAVGCGIRNRNENPDKVFSQAEARMYLDKHDYHKRLLEQMDSVSDRV